LIDLNILEMDYTEESVEDEESRLRQALLEKQKVKQTGESSKTSPKVIVTFGESGEKLVSPKFIFPLIFL
jgi:hypothetical protein